MEHEYIETDEKEVAVSRDTAITVYSVEELQFNKQPSPSVAPTGKSKAHFLKHVQLEPGEGDQHVVDKILV